MASAIHLALLAPVAFALVTSALTYWQGWTYYLGGEPYSEGEPQSEPVPKGVSVIVPLRGATEGLERFLDDLLRQRGAQPLEVIVAVEETGDPAAFRVRELAKSRDGLRLVVAEEAQAEGLGIEGTGAEGTGKIASLIGGVHEATHDHLAFVDADVHLAPEALQRLVRPLSDPSVGVAFAAQVGAKSPNLPAAFNHIFVNDSAFTNWAAAQRDGLPGAVGAFMATRRDVLESVGGLQAFADQIVMDIPLGQAAQEAGYELYLLRKPVRVGGHPEMWTEVLRRQHRWMVSIRTYVPSFPAVALATSLPETWSLLFGAWAILQGTFLGAAVLAIGLVLGWKVGSAAFVNWAVARDEGLWPWLWVALFAELIWLGVFLWSLASSRVYWAGRRFEVGTGGSKRLIER